MILDSVELASVIIKSSETYILNRRTVSHSCHFKRVSPFLLGIYFFYQT